VHARPNDGRTAHRLTRDGESAESDGERETRDGSDRVCRVADTEQEHCLQAETFPQTDTITLQSVISFTAHITCLSTTITL